MRHIERTQLLLFVLDASGFEGRDPIEDFAILQKEIALYNPSLLKKPYAVLLNKADLEGAEQVVFNFRAMHPNIAIFEISALTGQGLTAVPAS